MKLLVLTCVFACLHQHGLLVYVLNELLLLLESIILLLVIRLLHLGVSYPELLIGQKWRDLILDDGMAEGFKLPDLLFSPVNLYDDILDDLGLVWDLLKANAVGHFQLDALIH
jgi:hypothetical protein